MQQIKTYPTLGKASSRTIDSGAQTQEGSGRGWKCGKATICYKFVDRNKGTHSGWQDVFLAAPVPSDPLRLSPLRVFRFLRGRLQDAPLIDRDTTTWRSRASHPMESQAAEKESVNRKRPHTSALYAPLIAIKKRFSSLFQKIYSKPSVQYSRSTACINNIVR